MVSALDFQAGYRGFDSRSGRDNFQTIITPSSYSACPGLSIKWTGRRLVTDSGTKCAWMIHESNAVQIHLHHSNRRCLYVPWVPGSVKNPHNNNNKISLCWIKVTLRKYANSIILISPPKTESFQINKFDFFFFFFFFFVFLLKL